MNALRLALALVLVVGCEERERPPRAVTRAPPREEPHRILPVCGSDAWRSMHEAFEAACASPRGDLEADACRTLADWRCPARIQEAFPRWGPGRVMVMKPTGGGEWRAAVLGQRDDGAWYLAGFDGGEVP